MRSGAHSSHCAWSQRCRDNDECGDRVTEFDVVPAIVLSVLSKPFSATGQSKCNFSTLSQEMDPYFQPPTANKETDMVLLDSSEEGFVTHVTAPKAWRGVESLPFMVCHRHSSVAPSGAPTFRISTVSRLPSTPPPPRANTNPVPVAEHAAWLCPRGEFCEQRRNDYKNKRF